MRQLLPVPTDDVDLVDLVDAYAFPRDRPWVRAMMIQSADGAAAVAGRSGGLAGPADTRLFALLRHLADVLLVGSGTARAEQYGPQPAPAEPRLQALRRDLGQAAAPVMALVSARLDLDPAGPLFTTPSARTLVLTCEASPRERRAVLSRTADVVVVGDERVDVAAAVEALVGRGLSRVSCEGGPTLLAQVVAAGLLDELCLTTAPRLVGGEAPRVLDGPASAPPGGMPVRLAHLLEDDGFLFARYVRGPAAG